MVDNFPPHTGDIRTQPPKRMQIGDLQIEPENKPEPEQRASEDNESPIDIAFMMTFEIPADWTIPEIPTSEALAEAQSKCVVRSGCVACTECNTRRRKCVWEDKEADSLCVLCRQKLKKTTERQARIESRKMGGGAGMVRPNHARAG